MIQRKLLEELKTHLPKKEISFIVGPRQAGKTTLMLLLIEELERRGERTVFFNLDIENDKQFFTSQNTLLRKIQLEIGQRKGFVFIDEIQRKENAGIFLKGLYDMNLPYKFIVSGSGSVELKEKIHESLAGRKRIFELFPVSFEEFVHLKTGYRYIHNLQDFFSLETMRTKEFLDEYLQFGGYPRVLLEETLEGKRAIINEIYQSYLEKDISYLLKIKKTEDFSNLVKLLASQIGNLVNFSEISQTLGISQKTVKNYVWYLQKTFILEKITPYFKNVRKEITKSPAVYFYDLGLRNFALGLFGDIKGAQEYSFLFENFMFHLLREKLKMSSATIHFWRTKDGAEVDFVINKGKEQIPVEVKYQTLKNPIIPRSLRSFIVKYHPPQGAVVNLWLDAEAQFEGTNIRFIPFYMDITL